MLSNKLKYKSTLILSLLSAMVINGCQKIVSIDSPRTEILTTSVFSSDESALSAVRGIYSLMVTNNSFANGQIERYTGLSADELDNSSPELDQTGFFTNALLPVNNTLYNVFWKEAYSYIGNANAIIENLSLSNTVSDSLKKQLEGEARFIRAFCHFYLVNLFGKIPYIATTDYRVNMTASREEINVVYQKIISDLIAAKNSMTNDYSFSSGERAEPNKWAAVALLSRMYLYLGDWAKAEAEASSIINNTNLFTLVPELNDVFLMNSTEAIWQLQPVIPNSNTQQAQLFILKANPVVGSGVAISDQLYQHFEPGDKRKTDWIAQYTEGITYNYSNKYKVYLGPVSEYAVVLRLAEQYLIRAEARIQLGRIGEGIDDLNIIRARARDAASPGIPDPLPALSQSLSKPDALDAVLHERQVELFTEWGHRWLDLKRTKTANAVLSMIKGNSWQPTDTLYPIPQQERLLNPNLSQNSGY